MYHNEYHFTKKEWEAWKAKHGLHYVGRCAYNYKGLSGTFCEYKECNAIHTGDGSNVTVYTDL
jgi:hypothetical protein